MKNEKQIDELIEKLEEMHEKQSWKVKLNAGTSKGIKEMQTDIKLLGAISALYAVKSDNASFDNSFMKFIGE